MEYVKNANIRKIFLTQKHYFQYPFDILFWYKYKYFFILCEYVFMYKQNEYEIERKSLGRWKKKEKEENIMKIYI